MQVPGGESNRAFHYIIQENKWEEKQSMSIIRIFAACGYVMNAITNKNEVVVAGGYRYGSDYMSSTEIYTVEDDTWRAGAMLINLCDYFYL